MNESSVLEYPARVNIKPLTRTERRRLRKRKLISIDHELQKIGVVPFDDKSAYKYMGARVQDLRRPVTVVEAHHLMNADFIVIGILIATTTFPLWYADVISSFTFLKVFLFASILFLIGIRGRTHEIKRTIAPKLLAEWRVCLYDQFLEASVIHGLAPDGSVARVPQEVRTIAEKVRQIPHTQLRVHYLYEDPFLEMVFMPPRGQSASRFIAFWDESGFVH